MSKYFLFLLLLPLGCGKIEYGYCVYVDYRYPNGNKEIRMFFKTPVEAQVFVNGLPKENLLTLSINSCGN